MVRLIKCVVFSILSSQYLHSLHLTLCCFKLLSRCLKKTVFQENPPIVLTGSSIWCNSVLIWLSKGGAIKVITFSSQWNRERAWPVMEKSNCIAFALRKPLQHTICFSFLDWSWKMYSSGFVLSHCRFFPYTNLKNKLLWVNGLFKRASSKHSLDWACDLLDWYFLYIICLLLQAHQARNLLRDFQPESSHMSLPP